MTKELIERSRQRHEFVDLSLIVTTIALVVSLVIAFTAVSVGIARADTFGHIAQGGGRLGLAILLGLVIAAMGGLTAAMMHDSRYPPRRN